MFLNKTGMTPEEVKLALYASVVDILKSISVLATDPNVMHKLGKDAVSALELSEAKRIELEDADKTIASSKDYLAKEQTLRIELDTLHKKILSQHQDNLAALEIQKQENAKALSVSNIALTDRENVVKQSEQAIALRHNGLDELRAEHDAFKASLDQRENKLDEREKAITDREQAMQAIARQALA
jgi:hypothetical protein